MLYRNDPMARWRARRCAPLDIYIYILYLNTLRMYIHLRMRAYTVIYSVMPVYAYAYTIYYIYTKIRALGL